ncbi:MAG: hypothetical protein Q7Q71_09550 [Verrucomicrobiota bacterium JB023]|nr:hypothetical protein [Verrucomicrobiota bacterium JB023]
MKFSGFWQNSLAALALVTPLAAETEEAEATDKVIPEGFKVSVFAEPFEVEYPTALTAGADGTVYVSVDPNGSLGKGRVGKVVACRDEDGDGRADKFWDYVPELVSPRGGHFVEGKLYLIHPPYLSVFWDEDGDGVAEQSQRLVDGLGASAQESRGGDHTTNGVRMGVDGWLYIAVGDFGMSSATGTDGRSITLQGGGVARVRPDGSELEVYSYHSRNQCDVAISPYLDLFARDNTNDGKGWNIRVHHHTNLAEHGYPRLYKNFAGETTLPLLDLGGGSGTGALYLHEPGFPGDYGDMLFTCDWTTGKIYEHSLERSQGTFQATQAVWMDLVRAVDIDVDGESRLYTADWRGGRFRYAGEGVEVGRIHRVVPEPQPKVEPWPDLAAFSPLDLVAQLEHRSAVRRLEAQRELLSRGKSEEVVSALTELAAGEAPLYSKVVALFALKQLLGEEAHPHLLPFFEHDELREFVLRALGDRRPEAKGIPLDRLRRGLSNPDPRVRQQAAIAIERGGHRELAKDLIATVARAWAEEPDRESRRSLRDAHTAMQALRHLEAAEACLKALKDETTREVALAALRYLPTPEVVVGLRRYLADEAPEADRLDVMETLARLSHREGEWDEESWWGTRPDDRGPYFEPVRWSSSALAIQGLEEAFAKLPETGGERERALEIFAANRLDVTKMNLGEQDPVLMALGLPEIGPAEVEILTSAATDSERKWEQRLSAYRAIARAEFEESSQEVGEGKTLSRLALEARLKILAAWKEEEATREAAAREIAEFCNAPALILQLGTLRKVAREESPEVSAIAWRAILSFSQSPLIKKSQRAKALALAQDSPREIGFFRALRELKLEGFDEVITNAIDSDNALLTAAAKEARDAIAHGQQAKADGGQKIAELDPAEATRLVMDGKGDIGLGKEIYTRQGCASCHAVSLEEVQKGPFLGTAGGKFTRDYLIESVLAPNATVAQGFVTELITLKDGSAVLGFITRNEDGEIDVRNIGGVVTTVKSADVAKREEQAISMMPAGLASGLTVHEFTSLIDYLGSMK